MIRHRLLCLGYFDFGSVGLFSLGFLSLFAVQTQHGQNTAADEQSSQPTDEVAAVTGLRRLGGVVLSELIGVIITATCIAGAAAVGELGDDRILAALSAANGAFLVLDAGGLLGSGLVDHPLEAVCCRVGLVADTHTHASDWCRHTSNLCRSCGYECCLLRGSLRFQAPSCRRCIPYA